MKWLEVEEFLVQKTIIFDVRSPIEFEKGHIPQAHNLPLFSDEERARVGTMYKQHGKQDAIDLGLEIVGPKMSAIVREVRQHTAGEKHIFIHCFRGGMRSKSVAWLLELCGFQVTLLQGGYKAFRKWITAQFSKSYPLVVLGGLTGSAKTEILHAIQEKGESVLDLEGLANHKGSAFGALGCEEQPTQVQFENDLGMTLFLYTDAQRIWVEDESRTIGRRVIPHHFWPQMRSTTVLFLERTMDDRLDHLMSGYGRFSQEELQLCAEKIRKRFGPDRTKDLLALIENGELREAMRLVLQYYDKGYLHGLSKRKAVHVHRVPVIGLNHHQVASDVMEFLYRI